MKMGKEAEKKLHREISVLIKPLIKTISFLFRQIGFLIRQLALLVSLMRHITDKSKGLCHVAMITPMIPIPTEEGYDYLVRDKVIWLEATGSYTVFYMTTGEKKITSYRLRTVEKQLGIQFFRIHHSHMVNRQYIIRFVEDQKRGGWVIMINGQKVEVSQRRRDDFLDWMNGY